MHNRRFLFLILHLGILIFFSFFSVVAAIDVSAFVTNSATCAPGVANLNNASTPFCSLADAAEAINAMPSADPLSTTFVHLINDDTAAFFNLATTSVFSGLNRSALVIDCPNKACTIKCNSQFTAINFTEANYAIEISDVAIMACQSGIYASFHRSELVATSAFNLTLTNVLLDQIALNPIETNYTVEDGNLTSSVNLKDVVVRSTLSGQVLVRAQTVRAENCVFDNNTSTATGYGGAMAWLSVNGSAMTQSIVVSNCSFVNSNYSIFNGGGLYLEMSNWDQPHEVDISESDFTNNIANYGGGLDMNLQNSGTFSIRSCNFLRNSAVQGAGLGVYAIGSLQVSLLIADSNFDGNNAIDTGGGLLINAGSNDGNVTIQSSIFRHNSASETAAIYLIDFTYAQIQGCYIANNFAYENIVQLSPHYGSGTLINATEISYNQASVALQFNEALGEQMEVTNSAISFNSMDAITGSKFNAKRDMVSRSLPNDVKVGVSNSYIWGNGGVALSANNLKIDASGSNSVWQNAWALPGNIDTICGDLSVSELLMPGAQRNGCMPCSASARDICGECGGDSACLSGSCKLPYTSLCSAPAIFNTKANIAVTYSGINPVLRSADLLTELVTLKFYSLIDISASGKQVVYPLDKVTFLPSNVYSTNLGGSQTTIGFQGILSNGARVAVQQTLFGESQLVDYADTSFTVKDSTLKVAVIILGWPTSNTVRLNMRAVYDSVIKNLTTASTTRENIIKDTTIRSRYTTTSLALANVFVSTDDMGNSAIKPVTLKSKRIGDSTVEFAIDFQGPINNVVYDPDIGALVSPDAGDGGSGDGDDDKSLLIKILVPVLIGTCVICICLIIIITIIVTVILRYRDRFHLRVEGYDDNIEI